MIRFPNIGGSFWPWMPPIFTVLRLQLVESIVKSRI